MKKTDLRVVKTLREIDEALLQNIAVRPFRDVTLGMLCETALINKTTFYRYYSDKYDCLNSYLDRLMAEFRNRLDTEFLRALPADLDKGAYRTQFLHLAQFVYSHKREYLTVWQAQLDRQLFDEMTAAMGESVLQAARAGRSYDPRQEAFLTLYARLFSVHAMSLFDWWFRNEGLVTVDDVLSLMTGNMRSGLFATFRRLL